MIHHQRTRADAANLAVVGQNKSFKQLVGALQGVVDDLLGRIGVAHGQNGWVGKERQCYGVSRGCQSAIQRPAMELSGI